MMSWLTSVPSQGKFVRSRRGWGCRGLACGYKGSIGNSNSITHLDGVSTYNVERQETVCFLVSMLTCHIPRVAAEKRAGSRIFMYPHKCKERVTEVRTRQWRSGKYGAGKQVSREPEKWWAKEWNEGQKLEAFGSGGQRRPMCDLGLLLKHLCGMADSYMVSWVWLLELGWKEKWQEQSWLRSWKMRCSCVTIVEGYSGVQRNPEIGEGWSSVGRDCC